MFDGYKTLSFHIYQTKQSLKLKISLIRFVRLRGKSEVFKIITGELSYLTLRLRSFRMNNHRDTK